VNDLITEVLTLVRDVSRRHQVDIQTGRDIPPVKGDRVQLQQVVLNLDGGEIRASANRGPGATFEFTLPTLGGTAPAVAA
jgi:signal transduction histidine kinase